MVSKILQIMGFFLGFIFLLVGFFLCIDAFIPKSELVSFRFLLGEFAFGVAIVVVSYLLIRRLRKY